MKILSHNRKSPGEDSNQSFSKHNQVEKAYCHTAQIRYVSYYQKRDPGNQFSAFGINEQPCNSMEHSLS
jgi:hypothetical protein